MRPSIVVLSALLSSVTTIALLSTRDVSAQVTVSDADRAAARELYVQGVQLQQNGKYAEALDKFQRAQSVLLAPTHQLHIAECQAALGKLVESAETYRALIRAPLAAAAPPAFTAAQAQGTAELPQVDSRIPELKLDVTPSNAPGLQVLIDDQAMSTGLVGVSRPINPGTHKIVVAASGYSKSEQTLTIKERETKALAITLQPSSSPALVPPPPPVGPASAGGPSPAVASAAPPPPSPEAYSPELSKIVSPQPSTAFLLGGRIGVIVPGGSIAQDFGMDKRAGTGAAFALEAGFRVARTIYLGADLEISALSGPSSPIDFGAGKTATYTAQAGLFAAHLGIITNPHGVGFYGDIGAGFRLLRNAARIELQSDASKFVEADDTFTGAEFLLAAGIYIKVSEALRLIPKAQLGFGSFKSVSSTCTGSGNGNSKECSAFNSSDTIPNTAGHTFVFLGIGGYFAHDFK
jgi:hypothetical protein